MPDMKKTDAITLTFKKVSDRPGAMTVFGQSLNGPESTVLLEPGVSFHVRCEGGQLVLATRAGDPDRLTEGEECVAMLARCDVLGAERPGERPRLYLRRLIDEVIRLQALEVEHESFDTLVDAHKAIERGEYSDLPPLGDSRRLRIDPAMGILQNPTGADLVDANLKPIEEIEVEDALSPESRKQVDAEQAGREAFQKAKADIQAGQAARGEPQSEDAQEKF